MNTSCSIRKIVLFGVIVIPQIWAFNISLFGSSAEADAINSDERLRLKAAVELLEAEDYSTLRKLVSERGGEKRIEIRLSALARAMNRTNPEMTKRLRNYLLAQLGEVPSGRDPAGLIQYYKRRATIEEVSGNDSGALGAYKLMVSLLDEPNRTLEAKIKALKLRVGGEQ
jgi:hypothetical protein